MKPLPTANALRRRLNKNINPFYGYAILVLALVITLSLFFVPPLYRNATDSHAKRENAYQQKLKECSGTVYIYVNPHVFSAKPPFISVPEAYDQFLGPKDPGYQRTLTRPCSRTRTTSFHA